MERLDFSSVMAVIRYYISPDHGMSQGELLTNCLTASTQKA